MTPLKKFKKNQDKILNDEFIPLFDKPELELSDISEIFKIREKLEPSTFYIHDKDKRKNVMEKTIKLFLSKYLSSINLKPYEILDEYYGKKYTEYVFAEIANNNGKTKSLSYLPNTNYISDSSFSKEMIEKYGEPRISISISGYEDHFFHGETRKHYMMYGSLSTFDWYFFNILNLKIGTSFILNEVDTYDEQNEDGVDVVYKISNLNVLSVSPDTKISIGIKYTGTNDDVLTGDNTEIKLRGYPVCIRRISFSEGRSIIFDPNNQQGLHLDILSHDIEYIKLIQR